MGGMLPELHKVANGSTSSTSSSAATLISAPDLGRLYVASAQFGRTDANSNAIVVTLNDTVTTQLVVPNPQGVGYVQTYVFDSPLQLTPKTALTMTPNSAVTTLFGAAQGFVLE